MYYRHILRLSATKGLTLKVRGVIERGQDHASVWDSDCRERCQVNLESTVYAARDTKSAGNQRPDDEIMTHNCHQPTAVVRCHGIEGSNSAIACFPLALTDGAGGQPG